MILDEGPNLRVVSVWPCVPISWGKLPPASGPCIPIVPVKLTTQCTSLPFARSGPPEDGLTEQARSLEGIIADFERAENKATRLQGFQDPELARDTELVGRGVRSVAYDLRHLGNFLFSQPLPIRLIRAVISEAERKSTQAHRLRLEVLALQLRSRAAFWFAPGREARAERFLRERLGIYSLLREHLELLWRYTAGPSIGRSLKALGQHTSYQEFTHWLTKIIAQDAQRLSEERELQDKLDPVERPRAGGPPPIGGSWRRVGDDRAFADDSSPGLPQSDSAEEMLIAYEQEALRDIQAMAKSAVAGTARHQLEAIVEVEAHGAPHERELLKRIMDGETPAEALRRMGLSRSTWDALQKKIRRHARKSGP